MNFARGLRRLLLSVAALTCMCLGQTTTGSFNGTVTDPSSAAVGGVKVQVTSSGTGLQRSAVTGDNGKYTIPLLPPGTYNISIEKSGFATTKRSNIQLLVNQSATLDFKLSVSAVSETVDVTGAPPTLNTTNATIGQVIEHQQIVDFPLNGRSFTQLTLLTPGAVPQESGQQNSFTVRQGAGGVSPSVNGQRGQENNFTMDGVLNNSIYTNTWAISPPPDALGEFNVQSHITDSQFSISSGANINIVSRSGTNQFHGSVWEFIRNSALDSRSPFDQGGVPPYKQNQYGVNFGGPVLLPHYNGRNRTFFDVYWEGFRSIQSLSYQEEVPTAAMRQGDFSGISTPIYNPYTSVANANGTVTRTQFPGNKIPSTLFNPSSLLVLQKYYPLPNLNLAEGANPNYEFQGNNNTASDQTGIRIDHRFGDNDTIFGRYNRSNQNLIRPESLPTYIQSLNNYAQTVALGYTHLFGPTSILSLHYGYTNTNAGQFDDPAGQSFLTATNFGQLAPAKNGIALGPQIGISNGYNGVSQYAIPLGPQENHDGHADLSLVRGKHTIGIGAMIYHVHSFDDGWGMETDFNQNATSSNGQVNGTGYGPASFLLGLPTNVAGFLGDTSANQQTFWYGGYVQDQWQASQKLTLTMGLRYDLVLPAHYTKVVSGLDIGTGNFLVSTPAPPLFVQPNVRPTYFDPHYNGFEPRFGLAYRASETTVFRAAFAMFDDHNNTLVQESQDPRQSWPAGVGVALSNQNQGVPNITFNNLPTYASFFNPLQPYVDFGADPRNKIPYVMEYNAGIEQQLGHAYVLSADYVGSQGRHQFIQPAANTAYIPGPGPLASRGQPFPQYASGSFSYDENVGNSNYNALQAKLQKTLSFGLSFLASYTWSKSMDIQSEGQSGSIASIYNLRADYAPSDFNRSQLFVWSGIYQLPFGKGKQHLANSKGVVEALLGNWNLTSIVTFISGQPYDIIAGGDVANVGGGTQRAQVVGNPNTGFTRSPSEWFNVNAFAIPGLYTFGNEGRNNLTGPPEKNVDFSVYKDFSLGERATLQFRSEFFNIFNHPAFGTPNNNVQATNLGDITGLATGTFPRQIQFALKLSF